MIRLLITGSREWPIARKLEVWIALDDAYRRTMNDLGILTFNKVDVTLVSGACPRGVDAIAEAFAAERGWTVERHPAAWDLHQKAAGFIRNQEMADLGADACAAMPLGRSPGTRDMIRRAEKAGIPTTVHEGQADE
jgi:YspA, cpYpsA-related SLOG family